MNKRNLRNGLLFISPWIIGFLVFTLYPVCSSFYYSLSDYNMISNPQFVGLANYTALFQDPTFLTALGNTVYMVVIGMTMITVATVTIAILLNNKRLKGMSVFRVVFFLPTLVPTVVLSVLWIWILDPQSGVVNTLLGYVGIRGPGWLADPHWTKPAFILMCLWGSGNAIIIYLAGLQDISPSLYEAASLDGANALQKAWYITIPMLRPVIVFKLVGVEMKILVTGAARGLGYSATEFFLEQGHTVYAGVRSLDHISNLSDLTKSYPTTLQICELDVAQEQSVMRCRQQIVARESVLDAIINNAGILLNGHHRISDVNLNDFEQTFQVNTFGPIRVVKHFIDLLLQGRNPAIVNLISEAGSLTTSGNSNYSYCMSKTALNMFSHILKEDLEGAVRVYALHPGRMRTDMGVKISHYTPVKQLKRYISC